MTAADGKACRSKLYSLDAILAVGCRVRPPRRAVSPLGHIHADGASRGVTDGSPNQPVALN